jgi:hypothetical protein
MAKYSKDIDVLVRLAVKAGWEVRQSSGKHPVLYPTDKKQPPIVVPVSLSDHRGFQNFKSYLRRAGLSV